MNITILNDENFDTEIVNSEKPVLVDFWAEWCMPCKMLAPVIEEIAGERDDIKVCKMNVDQCPVTSVKYRIASIPTVMIFKKGQLVTGAVGVQPKEELEKLIVKAL